MQNKVFKIDPFHFAKGSNCQTSDFQKTKAAKFKSYKATKAAIVENLKIAKCINTEFARV